MSSRITIWPAFILCLLIQTAPAEDAAQTVDPLMKLATARAKVEITLRDGSPVFDRTNNGFAAAETAIERTKDTITDILSKSRQNNADDEEYIATIEQTATELQSKWDMASREYDTDISPRYEAANESFGALKNVFTTLANSEQEWKQARIDLDPLERAFAALDKRLAETIVAGRKATDDLKSRQKTWESELATIRESVSSHDVTTKPGKKK
jgi:predicted  nucleic acid-binding Zn-ribbon protein